ncbi:sulfotransferase domain-containing protein [Rhodohalobacter sp. 614A]|uniref:sulfotransferase domain-containing protein n=1 Tax=Rhodohalobacter sp. 614A TaxID=2908649 RepID=UPI001F3EA648|nr:sulfotransferase domain-containing protein [Rhodohalobacter sp. 614A]
MPKKLKPNLFIVGQPKSGTTAFYEFLKSHPDIYLPPQKEIHYFCKDFHKENERYHGECLHFTYRTEPEFLSLFVDQNGEKVIGEASVNYFYSEVAAQNIHNFNSDSKILIFLRNPVDFLKSWHAHSLLTNGETYESLEDALNAEERRKNGDDLTQIIKVPSYLFYTERLHYVKHLKRFLDVFPKEQIKVIIYDDIVLNIGEVYKEILSFLDVDKDFEPDFKVINSRKKIRFKSVLRFTKFPKVKKLMNLAISRKIRQNIGLQKLFKKIFLVPFDKYPENENLEKDIKKKFEEEVIQLSDILDRDLKGLWNF